jgi:hypothetical protein
MNQWLAEGQHDEQCFTITQTVTYQIRVED